MTVEILGQGQPYRVHLTMINNDGNVTPSSPLNMLSEIPAVVGVGNNTWLWDNVTEITANVTKSGVFIPPEPNFSVPVLVVLSIGAAILSFLTFGGNFMVMVSFKMDKQLQTVSNYFLLSLAIADFWIGLVSMPLFTVYTLQSYWSMGPWVCDTYLALDYLMSNASVLNLLIISFDRYFSVTRPLTYRARRTPKRAAVMISCAWIISLLLWPPWIYAWPYIEGERKVREGQCYIQFLETNKIVTFATAVAAFYVPVTVITVLYWRIWLETEKRKKDLVGLQALKDDRTNGSKKSSSSDGEHVMHASVKRAEYDSGGEEAEQEPVHECDHHARPPNIWQRMNCCKKIIDRDTDFVEEETSSDTPGSPAGSINQGLSEFSASSTPSRPTSLKVCSQLKADKYREKEKHPRANCTLIPLMSADKNENGPRDQTLLQTRKTNSEETDPSENVFTILIKLPPEGLNDSEQKPTITMYSDRPRKEVPKSPRISPVEEKPRADNVSAETQATRLVSVPATPPVRPQQHHHHHHHQDHSTSTTTHHGGDPTKSATAQAKYAAKLAFKVKSQRTRKKRAEKKQDQKAAKTLTAILLAFIITWTPYNIFVLVMTYCYECIPTPLYNASYYFCYINSTINPLLYALCNVHFRRTFIRIMTCRWSLKKRTQQMVANNRAAYLHRS